MARERDDEDDLIAAAPPEDVAAAAASPTDPYRLDDSAAEAEDEPPPPSRPVAMSFGTGLLPRESQAELGVGLFKIGGFSVGLLYISGVSRRLGAGFSLGLDLALKEIASPLFYRAVLAEFLATLLFLWFGVTTVIMRSRFSAAPEDDTALSAINDYGGGTQLMIAAAFGFAIFVLVFIFAPLSGAHINPAVSYGLALTRKITVVRMLFYIGAQMGGAVVGTLLAKAVSPSVFNAAGGGTLGNGDPSAISWNGMLLAEAMGTLLLVLTVYTVADPQRASTSVSISSLTPFALGMAVFVAHLPTIPVTGCGINPARAFGPAAVTGTWDDQNVFWAGPILGATVAALLFEVFFKSRAEFEEKWRPAKKLQ